MIKYYNLKIFLASIMVLLSACNKSDGRDYVTEQLEAKKNEFSALGEETFMGTYDEDAEGLSGLYDEGFWPELSEDGMNIAMIRFEAAYFNGDDGEYTKVAVNDKGQLILTYIFAFNGNKADFKDETRPAGGTEKEPDWYIGVLEYNVPEGTWNIQYYKHMTGYVYVDGYTCRYLYNREENGQEYLLFGYVQGSIEGAVALSD